ncbi:MULTISPECIES: HEPN domain-containing protein [unclassified Rhizobium]|uniref:HEPN domain-containing protein n=1 Tax=unclassified Rhizobium TaxID=2613769 RepID=UPI00160AE80E|nr:MULTISPECIES: HEPN domain-containing protein [unclassified Rhizobium]MBB3382058.1 hypothetical protein [Rhizobium sp. BK098]MBB3613760.1 hypothetical protein [Rhizobium sp. BK609]MBB3679418.1 hypothetical protein [Rhizobium sp. BK612]
MSRFEGCNDAFAHAIARARDMIQLFNGLSHIRRDPANDDALRAAYFQAVSSFDFYVHEIVAIEASYRFRNAIPTRNIVLPMEITMISGAEERYTAVDADIRERNSYKAFVDPQKLSEVLSCFCNKPWELIVENHNELHNENVDKSSLMAQLKSIWKRRNKIAHEADVNPTLSGISLWPIDQADTEITVRFVEKLGQCLPNVVSNLL